MLYIVFPNFLTSQYALTWSTINQSAQRTSSEAQYFPAYHPPSSPEYLDIEPEFSE